jgi:hypothetical protein
MGLEPDSGKIVSLVSKRYSLLFQYICADNDHLPTVYNDYDKKRLKLQG